MALPEPAAERSAPPARDDEADLHVPPSDASAARPAPLSASPGDDRIVTIPNLLTLGRLLLLPVFPWLVLGTEAYVAAAAFLGVLSATDFLDGYIARHFDQGSRFGKLFDPTADRILFFVAILTILAAGAAPRWFALVVLVREVVVAAITVTLVAMGCPPVDVTWYGKAGTFLLMFAFPLFLAGSDPDWPAADLATFAGWATGLPGLAISMFAAVRYVPLWRESIHEGRVLRAARTTVPGTEAP